MSEDATAAEAVRKFLSVAAAAKVLGLSEMTLYRVIQANSFPAVKVGRRLFIPSQALDDMAAAAISSGGVVDAAEWRPAQVAG
ncbi:helix-turn-helix domain-containing protein [Kribbella jiaozuonensis]|uniref:Helix-turn-helix domain-containing protein n=1 Tax=Kribbella jiaozuonensis TaxID=2575441 RepID=A0A4U3M517_9ACTN|nr:helix-turn-helix domain-containing protein [Kribbella jiaozuonensis]TKK79159.1 helix-turn-helix domain-containing protein [Kribbella jiaozuonensis]TKK83229.1 helix-turn-helix domain-containing protein [Kribbella jiaozuonensis]